MNRLLPRLRGTRRAVLNVSMLRAMSGLSGLARQVVLYRAFGASGQMDAYFVVQTVIQSVFGTVDAAISNAMVPVYALRSAVSREEGEHFGRGLFVWVAGLSIVAFLALLIAAPLWVRAAAPGLTGARMHEATQLLRVCAVSVVFMSMASVTAGYLQYAGSFNRARPDP